MPEINSNLNKWDYSGVSHVCYSDPECLSYKKAAEFLGADQPVEDWGGGTGWAKRYFTGPYKNIDGSPHPNVDVVADLTKYKSKVDNILIRQVLECNPDWKMILRNAVMSFNKKLCIIIGTPLVETTREGESNPVVKADGTHTGEYIQEMYFAKADLLADLPGFKITEEEVDTNQYYHKDHIFYVEKI